MPTFAAVQASHAAYSYAPNHLPVAIFTGGTSGIGRAMVEAFARYIKGRAHIITIGRNREAGEAIVASFPKPVDCDDGWKHEFVSCYISLMFNIRSTCAASIGRFERINFLVLGAGYVSFSLTKETSECDYCRPFIIYYRIIHLINLLAIRGRKT